MIDFSNVAELKERYVKRFGVVMKGKFAEISKPVSHLDYFPYEMLAQIYSGEGKSVIYQDLKDSQWTLGVIFCEMFTGHHPFSFLEPY